MISVSAFATADDTVSPSQNPQFNAITPSGKIEPEKKGFLQRSYESWEKEEWEPNTQPETEAQDNESVSETPQELNKAVTVSEPETDNPSETEEEINASKTFKLQYYFDKWGRYLDEKEKQKSGPSHTEKLDDMPVIGNPGNN